MLVSTCIHTVQENLEAMATGVFQKIDRIYQQSQANAKEGQPAMPQDSKEVEKQIKSLLETNFKNKMYSMLMGKKQQTELVQQFQKKANMIVRGTQTESRPVSIAIQTKKLSTKSIAI